MKKLIILYITMITISCSLPENMGVPSWETNLNFYIINSNYQAVDLAESDSTFIASGDTLLLFKEINESELVEFSSDPTSDEEQEEIGNLEIENPEPSINQMPLSDFAPSLTDGIIPAPGVIAFSLPEVIKDDIEPFSEFQEISCVSGQAVITTTNNTAIWFGNIAAGEPLIITLLDVDGNELFSTPFSQDVPPLATSVITESIELSGKNLKNEFQLKITGGSRGSDGEEADIITNATFDIEINIQNVIADYAIAQIKQQEVTENINIDLDDSIIIQNAIVADNGYQVQIDFENLVDLDIEVLLEIEKLILKDETEPFSKEIIVPRSNGSVSHYTEYIDISGASLGDGTYLDTLDVIVTGVTIDSGEDYREIAATDYFSTYSEVESLEFSYIKGILKPREQDVVENEEIIDVDYPHVEGEFALVGHSEIRMEIDTPLHTEMNIEIEGFNDDGESVRLTHNVTGENPFLAVNSGFSQVIFDSETYNLNELITILPNRIVYTLEPVIGDETETFIYNEGDEIVSNIFIEAELDFIAECIFIPKNDEGEPNINTVDSEAITQEQIDAFKTGNLVLNYLNDMGFNATVDLLISDQKNNNMDDLLNANEDKFTIIKVPEISQTVGAQMQQISIELGQSDLEVMLADSIFIVPRMYISSEAGTPISGGVTLQGLVNLVIEINDDLVNGGE